MELVHPAYLDFISQSKSKLYDLRVVPASLSWHVPRGDSLNASPHWLSLLCHSDQSFAVQCVVNAALIIRYTLLVFISSRTALIWNSKAREPSYQAQSPDLKSVHFFFFQKNYPNNGELIQPKKPKHSPPTWQRKKTQSNSEILMNGRQMVTYNFSRRWGAPSEWMGLYLIQSAERIQAVAR